MGTFSIWHWLIVLAVVLLLFGGRGKISQLMGDFGKGLKSFKKNVNDSESSEDADADTAEPTKRIADEGAESEGGTGSQQTKTDKAANG